jgi:SpoIID/LytB domain protein
MISSGAWLGLLALPLFGGTLDTLAPWIAVDELRVHVFPHVSGYGPQSQDSRVDEAALVSASGCEARSDDGALVASGTRLVFRSAELTGALRVHCGAGATTLEREPGRKSYAYHGDFLVSPGAPSGATRRLDILDLLPLETYLRGVVPIEMPASWPAAALRAQAIAARTYSVFHASLARMASEPWDVDDSVFYQAYTGTEDEDPRADQAISATSGQSLLYQGQVIQAFFSADSGGYTEEAGEAWPGMVAPFCSAKPELYTDADIDLSRWGTWTFQGRLADLTARLRAAGLIAPAETVSGIDVADADRDSSGRARFFTLALLAGGQARVPGPAFRRALGMKSTRARVAPPAGAGAYAFAGRGFGHGVGMSQLGAMTYASRYGWDERRILFFYYDSVTLCQARGPACEPL